MRNRLPHRKIRAALKKTAWAGNQSRYDIRFNSSRCLMRFDRNTMRSWTRFEMLNPLCGWNRSPCSRRKHWIWTFTTPFETFIVIRKSRGTKVLIEVLTRRFKGIIVCDGWKPYVRFTKRLQRCWAHLLRESKELSEDFVEAISCIMRLRSFMNH